MIRKYLPGFLEESFISELNYSESMGDAIFKVDKKNIIQFLSETKELSSNCLNPITVTLAEEDEEYIYMILVIPEYDVISDQCYLINRGVRDCALINIEPKFENNVTRFIQSMGLKCYKAITSDEETSNIYIYKSPLSQILINVIENEPDAIINDILIAKLLGYSNSDTEEFMKKSVGFWKEEMLEGVKMHFDDKYPEYFNYIGNVTVPARETKEVCLYPNEVQSTYHLLIEEVYPDKTAGFTISVFNSNDIHDAIIKYEKLISDYKNMGFNCIKEDKNNHLKMIENEDQLIIVRIIKQ